jgi:hypothetical protein
MSTADAVLQELKLRQIGEGKWRGNSPFRSDSDSDSFTLTVHDAEHGAWFDHVSDTGGTLYQLAKHLGIALPAQGPVSDTKRAETFEQFAQDHGVDVSVYERAGWKATTYQRIPAIAFNTKTGTRYRLLQGPAKYKSVTGYKACWYRLEEALAITKQSGMPLVLCNGEASTVPAQAMGVPATCITGGAERQIPEVLLQELTEAYRGDIVIALDCDEKGRASARKLHTQLKSVATLKPRIVDMRLGEKGDLADYLRLWSAKDLLALPDISVQEYIAALPRSITAAELQGITVPPLEYIIDELMVPGCYLLAGAPKSRKSFVALHMAIAIASGGVVFSRFKVPQRHGVLYLDLEMSQNSVYRRVRTMIDKSEQWPANLHFMFNDAWTFRGLEAGAHLDNWLDAHPDVRVVIIDVLAQWKEPVDPRTPVYTADYDALKFIQRIATRRNIAIIVVHHTNKSKLSKGDNPFDKISGSTGIQGAVDAMWLLMRDPENPMSTTLQMTDRNIFDIDRVDLIWDDYLGCHTIDPKLKLLQNTTAERRAIYNTLSESGTTMTPAELASAIGKSDANVKKMLSRLVQDQLIEKVGYGRYKAITINTTPPTNNGYSSYSGNSSYSSYSGYSVDESNPDGERRVTEEYPRVTGSNQRVTGEFEAVESPKPPKSNQSNQLLYREQIIRELGRKVMLERLLWPRIVRRTELEAFQEALTAMVESGELRRTETAQGPAYQTAIATV